MKAQGVQPTPEEHVDMIKGWAAAGELRRRVADGSVEAFLAQLGDMAFELCPSREASRGETSGVEGEEGAWLGRGRGGLCLSWRAEERQGGPR